MAKNTNIIDRIKDEEEIKIKLFESSINPSFSLLILDISSFLLCNLQLPFFSNLCSYLYPVQTCPYINQNDLGLKTTQS